jgi:hypothetical protein
MRWSSCGITGEDRGPEATDKCAYDTLESFEEGTPPSLRLLTVGPWACPQEVLRWNVCPGATHESNPQLFPFFEPPLSPGKWVLV